MGEVIRCRSEGNRWLADVEIRYRLSNEDVARRAKQFWEGAD